MLNGRDPRIDFFRGLALIFIFWDHVPHNPLANVTVQNFGFSDAAEIFVFLAGYAAVLAYGRILMRDGYVFACVKILRRVWTLYVVHIFLLALLMGIVIFANSHIETRDLVQEMGLEYFLTHTQQALLDELLLRFKPNLTDPLPLYIVLMMSLPITLPLLVRAPTLMVAISLAVYLLAPWQGWNLPASNGGVWYFNPVTWQCLFILGGASALRSPGPVDARPLLRQPLLVAAAVYVLVTCVITLSWRWPEVHDAWMPRAIGEWLYPISKTDLSPVRLLHFLALAYVTAKLLPDVGWTQQWLARQLARMGRYSLEVFCLGVVLAPLADMLNAMAGDSLAIKLTTALAGAALMAALAGWLDVNKQLNQRAAARAASLHS
ncbi:OpgC domain-containing protein [Pseudomonas carnis]|uniref:OpgC family protein n=1 Tax=Pseudomonas carnis TaxID=2487355 RepID=UPI0018D95CC4|nr:OpgC domain-containing protein [Pseudomonas carnis]MBH3369167.1 OpgC domain-containing protein [Pseudomonas carnis]